MELTEAMRKGNIDSDWARAIIQRLIENDHDGDVALLCKTFLTLKKPTGSEKKELLDTANFDAKVIDALRRIDVTGDNSPDKLEIVKVTTNILFNIPEYQTLHKEQDIIDEVSKTYHLTPVPQWVVLALMIHSIKEKDDKKNDDLYLRVVTTIDHRNNTTYFDCKIGPPYNVVLRNNPSYRQQHSKNWLFAKKSQ